MKKTILLSIAIGLNTPRCAMEAKAAAISKIEAASSKYMGAPYAADPLGEGPGAILDPDPIEREDAFDCMTFIETAMARALGTDIRLIRYKDGKADFMSRNHFVSIDWLENNAGLVEYADFGLLARVKKTTIDKSAWMKKTRGIDAAFPPEEASVPYIPSEDILKHRDKISADGQISADKPMLVFFVAKGEGADVSHAGFLIKHPDGRIMLRHASQWSGRVADTEFFEYVRRVKKYLGASFYRIKGL
ncbi:MAG: DUF1460 domain-containing protein [Rickettsiales bacterium]|jgi:hypothetical protein|nr:DUF1460 domain-containing protein [Rickettsiales bacterium]